MFVGNGLDLNISSTLAGDQLWYYTGAALLWPLEYELKSAVRNHLEEEFG